MIFLLLFFCGVGGEFLLRDHSLTRPFQTTLWHLQGSTVLTNEYIRLTGDVTSQRGAIWNSVPLRVANWRVEVQVQVHGKGKGDLFGDGMALWVVRDRMETGPVFGSKDFFYGIGFFLDTYNNYRGDSKRGVPYLSAIVNNGTFAYDHDKDGRGQEVGGCECKIRGQVATIQIDYENDELKVWCGVGDLNLCFGALNLELPGGSFLGVSAATGDLTDAHDVHALRVFELSPAAPRLNSIVPAFRNLNPNAEKEQSAEKPKWGIFAVFLFSLIGLILIVLIGLGGVHFYRQHLNEKRKRFY